MTTAVSTGTTIADITFSFIVGDENAVICENFGLVETTAGVVASLETKGADIPAIVVIVAYSDSNCTQLTAFKTLTYNLENEKFVKLALNNLNGGKYVKAMLWNEKTLLPLQEPEILSIG